jgi:putative CocE/NonD family hydrolase
MAEARARLAVNGPHDAPLMLSDDVTLAGDLYRPDAPGRYPVLLMRQPYGRRIASTIVLAHPAWYAAQGFIVLVQDVRGRGDSGGAFRVLEDDAADGAEALAFAADLPGSTGQVAMYGFSYQAMTQLMALAGASMAGTKRPDALAPAMGAWSVRDDWAHEGGAFRLAGNLGWAFQMGTEQARLAGDRTAFSTLAAAARDELPASDVPGRPQVIESHGRYAPHYNCWLADDRETFARFSPDAVLSNVTLDVLVLFVGGWLDFLLGGTLAMHRAFSAARPNGNRLIVGPWPHLPWSDAPGGLDLGEAATSDIDRETIRFFDWNLKGQGEPGPAVRLFDIGRKRWHDFAHRSQPKPTSLFLASSGLAATTATDGALTYEVQGAGDDRLVHDPWRPEPLIGGHAGQPMGFIDRAAFDARSDVAVYTSLPLGGAMLLAGDVAAELHVESDMPSPDLHCTLSILRPRDTRAITLVAGTLRVVDAVAPGPCLIAMRAICATLEAGTRLRLSIQAAATPAFAVNPGTGEKPETAAASAARVTTLCIRHGQDYPSRLLLPVAA